ncbi:MAG TPA: helix-turn-helix transcriptional regulator [Beutenbergiaceae bacterium]|nr:helix-turn-helix transcriptional regulator [Beutenbergiaceae bacterium]
MPGPHYATPRLPISVAAEWAGMHPQTLRQYDRLGLVVPRRTAGRGRRYSERDVDVLREVQRLSQEEGINLAGVKRILDLTERNERLVAEVQRLRGLTGATNRVFSATSAGDVVAMPLGQRRRSPAPTTRTSRGALVVWRPLR